jgi:4-hydroxy-2-oxoheptanedioate aldolase
LLPTLDFIFTASLLGPGTQVHEIGKREFLAGLGVGVTSAAAGQEAAAPAAGGYKPRRHNKAIELLEDGQPFYYIGADPRLPGYEQGRAMAGTWADAINWEMEHGTFDLANLREFMKGLADGGPTRSGHRFPTVIVSMPVLGYSEEYMYANSWVVAQVLSTGANALSLCHARDPKAVEVYVAAARYPFDFPGLPKLRFDGMRGSGSQNLPSKIWGVPPNRYVNIADPWPLNPKGELLLGTKIEDKYALQNSEKILAQPGVGFAEGGGGDMQMSLQGLDFFADQGPPKNGDGQQHFAPVVQQAQDRVLAACKANKVSFLHAATTLTIVDWIKRGATVIETNSEDVAKLGRAYTKRTMPV